MNDDAVWDAFATLAGTFAAGYSPAIPVIYSGTGGEPPDEGIWIECKYFPNRTLQYGVKASEVISLRGFCQAMVCNRPGAGLNPSMDVVRDLIAYFDTGTVLGPAYVSRPPYVSAVIEEPARVKLPITIPYAAHGSR
ncbi:MAG: hypothetical protein CMK46_06950 [Porticoccus sp.]|jgi:hypothetical protein|uniref:phage tail terminator-like protein n=1 Tax=Pseudomonadota TaxID=1224 RepID=UPI000C4C2724|nr:hypothetical protein [Rhodospirillaceae bacterium]MAY26190.1 hypothetical protein [Polycyclovorans sp.]MBG58011.1 hypothetical protein [Porticoccus sp.]QDP49884.1 MAG: hypothetical protein GOVbin132_28 [Prokaryotic dsDNA virus sp.]MAX61617.1 hypothetical protein [Rhodospirillaceae bacterium]|tara:strand:+ start:28953 stop:29363 length:411 start_codon:yes stop_codon:yes gene_type:complete